MNTYIINARFAGSTRQVGAFVEAPSCSTAVIKFTRDNVERVIAHIECTLCATQDTPKKL